MLYLKIKDTKKSFEAWGITAAQLNYNSMAADELTATSDILKQDFFDIESLVVLEVFYDAKRVFKGFLQNVNVSHNGNDETVSFSAQGLWKVLDETFFENTWLYSEVLPYTGLPAVCDRSKAQIFGKRIDVEDSLVSVWSNVRIIKVFKIAEYINSEVKKAFEITDNKGYFTFSTAEIYDDFYPPYEEIDGANFGAAIKACEKWEPLLMSWFDYSQNTPALYLKSGSLLSTVDLLASSCVEQIQIAPLIDSRPNAIALRVIKTNTVRNLLGQVNISREVWYTRPKAELSKSTLGMMIIPYDTRGVNFTSTIDFSRIADKLWSMVEGAAFGGSFSYYNRDFSFTLMGKRVSLKGTAYEALPLVVQSESINLMDGSRSVVVGANKQRELLSYMDQLRNRFENMQISQLLPKSAEAAT